MAATRAIYESLDPDRKEIRLLTLHRARFYNKRLSVKLKTVPFTSETEYIALSYVWGDSHKNVEILVNDTLCSVSANLASALKFFRRHKLLRRIPGGEPLPLWVDAISINQIDLHERSEQVAFMGEIYSNATHVFSWLGRPDEKGIDLALDLIGDITSRMDGDHSDHRSNCKYHKRCCSIFDMGSLGRKIPQIELKERLPRRYTDHMDRCIEPDEPTVKRFLEEISRRPDCCSNDSEFVTGNDLWNAVRALRFSRYWTRVWVQQEMALAQATDHCHYFFCGRSHLSMRNLDMFAKLASHAAEVGQRPSQMDELVWNGLRAGLFRWFRTNINDVRRLRPIASGQRDTLHAILNIADHCISRDPRDKLYALNAALGLGMVPDYELPVKDVYLQWFHNELKKVPPSSEDLSHFISVMLKYAGTSTGDNREKSLPSWLPDLSKIYPPEVRNKIPEDTTHYSIMPEQTAHLKGEVWNIYGCICGKINSLFSFPDSTYQNEMDSLAEIFKHLEGFKKQQMKRQADTGSNFESILEKALIHALFQGTDPGHDQPRKLEDWLLFWNVLEYGAIEEATLSGVSDLLLERINEQVRHHPEHQPEDSQVSQESIPASLFIKMMTDEMVHDTQLFVTDNGYVGCCYTAVRDEDQICILNEINYPVVLRRVNDHWIFVGMCYVYDISHVKPSEVIQRDGLEGQWFPIH